MDAAPTASTAEAEASTAPEAAPAAKANHPTGFRKAKAGSSGAGSAKKGQSDPEPKTAGASSVTTAEEAQSKASTKGGGGDAVKKNEPELDEDGKPILYTKSGTKRKQASTVITRQ